ncbi:MAG TPA: hypothetical protein VFX49_00830 [Chloroflexota bacterium]|nr:hypothetical protein [Chloroflexota bacterium]
MAHPRMARLFLAALLASLTLWSAGAPGAARAAGFRSSAAVRLTTEAFGEAAAIAATVESDQSLTGLVTVGVYASDGRPVFFRWFENQSLQPGRPATFAVAWQLPDLAAAEGFRVSVGVYGPDWSGPLHWNGQAGSVEVPPGTRGALPPIEVPADQRFGTLPPGAALPSGEECAGRVRRSAWELRPENWDANHAAPLAPGIPVALEGAQTVGGAQLAARVDGAFSGTTDEIIQWGACKWGLDEDVVRAVASRESRWWQAQLGDFNGSEYESYGLLQIRRPYAATAFPLAAHSTAFNVDYALAWRRACYEGFFSDGMPQGTRGDEWGCVGMWASGRWHDERGERYAGEVRQLLAQREWLRPGY